MEILQIKNLSFTYPDSERKALDELCLSVNQGEFIVVCGESGCGKSTLLKLLKKEIAPYGSVEGDIFYKSSSYEELPKITSVSEIGFVNQNPESQIVTDYVWHELAFGLESLGKDKKYIRRRTAEMASYFGIQDWYGKRTNELSGGQKQLLNLASVMAMQPEVLLLDEPTAQLDPISADNLISTIKKINRELGTTVIMVEHRLEEVFAECDRVVLMDRGKAVFADSPYRFGEYIKHIGNDTVTALLPSAMRIFNLLGGEGETPVTVRDGRAYITDNYKNEVTEQELSEYIISDECTVELKNICFRYEMDSKDVVNNVSLRINKAEHFCILGGNGTGKTTTLNIIGGLLKPYRGKVFINGRDIRSYKGNSLYFNNLAVLPQDPQSLFVAMTLKEDILEICRVRDFDKEESDKRINEICEKLNIVHLLDMHPYDLSGGEQQKAALAKVLLLEPKILLLDEPTKGIDAYAKLSIAKIIGELKNDGITVITVTHDVEFAANVADRCGMYFDGQLISVDTPVKFFSENTFYTTAANRISRGIFNNCITCDQVATLCKLNGRKGNV